MKKLIMIMLAFPLGLATSTSAQQQQKAMANSGVVLVSMLAIVGADSVFVPCALLLGEQRERECLEKKRLSSKQWLDYSALRSTKAAADDSQRVIPNPCQQARPYRNWKDAEITAAIVKEIGSGRTVPVDLAVEQQCRLR